MLIQTQACATHAHPLGLHDLVQPLQDLGARRHCRHTPTTRECAVSGGCAAFVTTPEQAIFQDFELGSTYCISVKLTNTSGKRAACRALEPAASVANVLELQMHPSGFLSAGMSCHMQLKFKPQVDEDLSTNITILTDLGKVTVPVKCFCKRADMSLSASKIDFGACTVGDRRSRTIELRNSGALQVCLIRAFLLCMPAHPASSHPQHPSVLD